MLRRTLLVIFVILFAALSQVAIAEADDSSSQLVGAVFGNQGEGPAKGARVLAFHLPTERVYTSEPIDERGGFRLTELPHGYFDLAVETADGLFVAGQVVKLPPNTMAVLSMMLDRAPGGAATESLAFAGTTITPAGIVEIRHHPKVTGRSFWSRPAGIAAMSGGGLLTLLALSGDSGGGGGSASPHTPD